MYTSSRIMCSKHIVTDKKSIHNILKCKNNVLKAHCYGNRRYALYSLLQQ